MSAPEVLLQRDGGVLTITINRPATRNAVDMAVAKSLADAIDQLDADDSLVVGVLTGAGNTFCSGMDLKAFSRGELPSIEGRGFAGFTEAPPAKPIIAAVEGWALAGGCELALAADMIVAADDARFGLPEVKRGLVARAGGLLRLPKVLSYPVALRMALTGEPMTAADAYQLGLVVELTEPGRALEAALSLADTIAANAPLAVRATKRIMADSVGWTAAPDFARQRAAAQHAFDSEDAKEGALAFAEKRAPVWKGR